MKTSITFNENTSPYAGKDRGHNLMFIASQENHINLKLKTRGFIYLDRIYEMLGVRWNVEWENLCMIYKPNVRIQLAIARDNGNGFDIDILT